MRHTRGRAPALLALLLATLALTGCSGGGEPASQAVFHTQPGMQPNAASQPCQLHQTQPPTPAYRGGPNGTTALELPFLAYYTANGNKSYCDGKPPTATDKAWAQLYIQLTGDSANVNRVLTG